MKERPQLSKIFSNEILLKRHFKKVHDEKRKGDKRKVSTANKSKPVNKTCEICDKVFSSSSNRQTHVDKVHLKKKRFTCNKCKKEYYHFTKLKNHFSDVHEKDKPPLKCSMCDYTTTNFGELTQHIKTEHKESKKFQCDVCMKSFQLKCNLKTHMKDVHLSTKPQKCCLCHFATNRRSNLKRHVKSKHSQ